MKDRTDLYFACAALGTLALAAAPAPQAHDDGARAPRRDQPAAVQQPEQAQRAGQDRQAGDRQVPVGRTRRERWLSTAVRLRQR